MINKINKYIKVNGISKYLENWKEIEDIQFTSSEDFLQFLQKKIQQYHKHSFILLNYNKNIIYDIRKPPTFYWDKKNKN